MAIRESYLVAITLVTLSLGCSDGSSAGDPGGSGGSGASGSASSNDTGGGGPGACSEIASPYAVTSTTLDASFVPADAVFGWGSELFTKVAVAVDETTGDVYVGFTRDENGGLSATIVAEGSTEPSASVDDAVLGGVAVTKDGVATLLFDPAAVDERKWAGVARFDAGGSESFRMELFDSPNLDDEGTKGAPGTSRLGYVSGSDELVAYFGHTQRYDDGVRHQGGYLATVDATGEQKLLSGWFGSHNLDQRLLVTGSDVALLGLGDAYPKGIFFSRLSAPDTHVVYLLAGNASGTTNGQLGGLVDLDGELVVPFITNRSISQELTPGDWPNVDEGISGQIVEAAHNGNEIGLLRVPSNGSLPEGDLAPVWIDAKLPEGARLESLKSARYGTGGLVLLAWAEVTGDDFDATRTYHTLVVDRDGGICQPKKTLGEDVAFSRGDDIVHRNDGSIVWANANGGSIRIVTLTPK